MHEEDPRGGFPAHLGCVVDHHHRRTLTGPLGELTVGARKTVAFRVP